MKNIRPRISQTSMQYLATLLLLLPMVLYAQSVLPLRVGFYSSDSCKDPPNAVLLHFDGKDLNGAHSASCRDKVAKLNAHVYRLDENCPALPLAKSDAYAVSVSQRLTVHSPTSFELVDAGNGNAPVRYRFCGTTLGGRHSF